MNGTFLSKLEAHAAANLTFLNGSSQPDLIHSQTGPKVVLNKNNFKLHRQQKSIGYIGIAFLSGAVNIERTKYNKMTAW